MDSKPSSSTNTGRYLVAIFLALIGGIFGVAAAAGAPSATRTAFIVIAIVMIAAAGATLGAALTARKRS
ncbi:MAG TPA: hypothetical protein VFN07_09515 [Trueperaceae bacterium]|nr:hypothetical protein [Trueperaceae bacterium]HRP46347.1 hypothetical protein [Trueperaceae bacterium]